MKSPMRMPSPPRESCSLSQRMQAADIAWHDFMNHQLRIEEGIEDEDINTTFVAFSRFTHELVDDHELRSLLLKCFEQRLYQKQAGMIHHGTLQ